MPTVNGKEIQTGDTINETLTITDFRSGYYGACSLEVPYIVMTSTDGTRHTWWGDNADQARYQLNLRVGDRVLVTARVSAVVPASQFGPGYSRLANVDLNKAGQSWKAYLKSEREARKARKARNQAPRVSIW